MSIYYLHIQHNILLPVVVQYLPHPTLLLAQLYLRDAALPRGFLQGYFLARNLHWLRYHSC